MYKGDTGGDFTGHVSMYPPKPEPPPCRIDTEGGEGRPMLFLFMSGVLIGVMLWAIILFTYNTVSVALGNDPETKCLDGVVCEQVDGYWLKTMRECIDIE